MAACVSSTVMPSPTRSPAAGLVMNARKPTSVLMIIGRMMPEKYVTLAARSRKMVKTSVGYGVVLTP